MCKKTLKIDDFTDTNIDSDYVESIKSNFDKFAIKKFIVQTPRIVKELIFIILENENAFLKRADIMLRNIFETYLFQNYIKFDNLKRETMNNYLEYERLILLELVSSILENEYNFEVQKAKTCYFQKIVKTQNKGKFFLKNLQKEMVSVIDTFSVSGKIKYLGQIFTNRSRKCCSIYAHNQKQTI